MYLQLNWLEKKISSLQIYHIFPLVEGCARNQKESQFYENFWPKFYKHHIYWFKCFLQHMSYSDFEILAFSTNFCPIKSFRFSKYSQIRTFCCIFNELFFKHCCNCLKVLTLLYGYLLHFPQKAA